MPKVARKDFHRQLEEIDARVVRLFALVTEGIAAATDSFLAGDREAARQIQDADVLLDELYTDIEGLVERTVMLQAPVAQEARFLLSVLRIVPELERSGDLAEHVAGRAAQGLGNKLTPAMRGLVERMGRRNVEMWRTAADAYAERNPAAVDTLDQADERVNVLTDELIAELGKGEIALPDAIEMALVARFYERLGDHAKHLAKRVRYLAVGA